MALGGAGYWNNNYFNQQYWHEDYWLETAAATPGVGGDSSDWFLIMRDEIYIVLASLTAWLWP